MYSLAFSINRAVLHFTIIIRAIEEVSCTNIETFGVHLFLFVEFNMNVINKRQRRQSRVRIRRRPRKIVVVGTMNSGKSSLISAYCCDQFSDIYQPTILRCLPSDARVQGHRIDIIIVDTPGRIDYLPIRRCAYQKADLIMICFALDQPVTLDHVKDYWIQEIKKHTSSVPYILVGTCVDKRDELYANWCNCSLCQECVLGCDKRWKISKTTNEYLQQTIVVYEQGKSLAKDIGALAYIECSAKYRDGTRQVFELATDIAVRKHRRKRKHKMRGPEGCTIL